MMESEGESGVLLREFSLRTVFALAFAFISPIVALYSIFALGLASVGPGFWLGFPVAMAGQLLVALVFAMLVSRFPLEGSVYQWSRHLAGARYGWFAGWTYICTLVITLAAVSLGGAGFIAQLLGLDPVQRDVVLPLALGLLAFATWGNTRGRHVLSALVALCVVAELIGSVGVGAWLLVAGRLQPLSVVFAAPDFFTGGAGWQGIFDSKAAAAVAICGWAFVGFESAGSVAEEMKNPSRDAPRAMLASLMFVAAVVSFAGLALLLAIPNLGAAMSGRSADPLMDILLAHFGPVIVRGLLVLFVIGFLACLLGVQASASRVIWAFARDGELPGSGVLVRLRGADRIPANAIVLSGMLAAALFAIAATNLYALLVAFTTAGFYIAFAFPLLAAAFTLLRGRWQPTPFALGALSGPVILAACAWNIAETVNIAWPRSAAAPWYEAWSVVLMTAFLGSLGALVRTLLEQREQRPLVVGGS